MFGGAKYVSGHLQIFNFYFKLRVVCAASVFVSVFRLIDCDLFFCFCLYQIGQIKSR